MYRIRSARLSSAPKACRYSTETPAKPRHLITELNGISIPSLSELKEQARQRQEQSKKKELDISYLKDAPKTSLAGRLAATVSHSKPEPRGAPRTQEDIRRMTEERRAARIARETVKVNEAMSQFKPSAVLERVAANFTGSSGSVQRSQRRDIPQRPRTHVKPQISRPATRSDPSQNEKRLQGVVENRDSTKTKEKETEKETETETETETEADQEPLVVQLEEPVLVEDAEVYPSTEIDTSAPRNDRRAAFEKKRKMLEKKLLSKAEFGQNRDKVTQAPVHNMKGRKEKRIIRETAEVSEPRSPRKSRNTNDIQSQTISVTRDIEALTFEEEEDRITPGFTGPEPVSATLAEFFKTSPTLHSFPPGRAPPLVSDYSNYIPASTDALFSKPVEELSAVDIATAALSHRADINLRKRKEALTSIATATRSRSAKVEARA